MLKIQGSNQVLPRWIVAFFIGGAIVLVPWIVILFGSLHETAIAKHWRLVWGGFDCFLLCGFALTGYRIMTRSPRAILAATATGIMLLIDAWFDVLTARRTGDVLTAVVMAIFAEIPCAVICFYVARRVLGLIEEGLGYLNAAGFRVVGGRLVPPEDQPLSEQPIPSK
jgi:hypothetical protein